MVIDTDWVPFWWVSAKWRNSSVLAMELCLSCTNLSIYMDIWSIYCLTLTSCISRKVMIVLLWKKSSCVILLFIVLVNKWLFPSVSYNYQLLMIYGCMDTKNNTGDNPYVFLPRWMIWLNRWLICLRWQIMVSVFLLVWKVFMWWNLLWTRALLIRSDDPPSRSPGHIEYIPYPFGGSTILQYYHYHFPSFLIRPKLFMVRELGVVKTCWN